MRSRTWHKCQPADLHELARHWFIGNRRIELQKLAGELGVSRATAYRWAGSAEQLVGAVLANLVDESFANLARQSPHSGSERIMDVLNRVMHLAHAFVPLRAYLRRDPQTGLRIVASKDGPVQARTIANLQQLIDEESAAGNLHSGVDSHVLAYALTRIVESFIYADLITGHKPDLANAEKILRLLLCSNAQVR